MAAIVHAADVQDRDGGVLLMATLFGAYPFLLRLYADRGYQGPKFQQGLKRVCREVNLEIDRVFMEEFPDDYDGRLTSL